MGAYSGIGNAHSRLGNYWEALQYHQKRLQIAEELGERGEVGRAYGNIGNAHHALSNYREALENHQQHLQIAEELGGRSGLGRAYGNIGNAHESLGNYRQALENYQQHLQIAEELGDRGGVGMAYANMGTAHQALSNYREALENHQKSLQIAEELGDRSSVGIAYSGIGIAHDSLGNYRGALENHQKSLQIAEELGDRGGVGIAYLGIGVAHERLSNYQEALQYHQKYLETAEELGNRDGVGKAYANIGTVHQALSNYREALENYRKALEIFEELGERGGVGGALNSLGSCHSYRASEQPFNKERETAWLEAERYYRRSVQVFSEIAEDLGDNPQAKISIFEQQSSAHRGLEQALIEQGKLLEALTASDGRRGRALFSALCARCVARDLSLPTDQEMAAADFTALAREQGSTLLVYSLALSQRSNLTSHIGLWLIPAAGEIEYHRLPAEELLAEIEDPAGEVFGVFPFRENAVGQGKRSLLQTQLSPEGLAALKRVEQALSQEERFSYREIMNSPYSDSFSAEDKELLLKIYGHEGAEESEEDREIGEESEAIVYAAFRQQLERWHRTLIAPVLESIPAGEPLIIVPDGYLGHLPFAAFRSEEGEYLIERHPLSFVPSVQLMRLPRQEHIENNKAWILGNPSQDLPLAEGEVKVIGSLLEAEGIFTGEEATSALFAEHAREARWLHLACHGLADIVPAEQPHTLFRGCLKLSDRRLYAQEIVGMDLKAELVFLSACQSGRGTRAQEGSVGLIWSLLGAGAEAAIATYWNLPDTDLTVQMVKECYARILGLHPEGKQSKAVALQKALLTGIAAERERPDRWAALFLSGTAGIGTGKL